MHHSDKNGIISEFCEDSNPAMIHQPVTDQTVLSIFRRVPETKD
ncbi:hypothetical protein O4H53_08350 [Sulfitobacter sp. G21635-S1]|jgi:hypothetical protein|nr:hypothetical protein [Sulfitobacter sp. G21635-S1]